MTLESNWKLSVGASLPKPHGPALPSPRAVLARPPVPSAAMWAISLLLLLLVETSSALRLPAALLDISRQHASAVACAALLASSQPVMPAFAVSCQLDCFKECNKVSRRGTPLLGVRPTAACVA